MVKRHRDFESLTDGVRLAERAVRSPERLRQEAGQWRDAFLRRLEREFLPPLDRRDLSALAERIAAVCLCLADAVELQPGVHPLPSAIAACTDALRTVTEALPSYRQPERFSPPVTALRRCASEAYRAFGRAAANAADLRSLVTQLAWQRCAAAFRSAAEAAVCAAINGV